MPIPSIKNENSFTFSIIANNAHVPAVTRYPFATIADIPAEVMDMILRYLDRTEIFDCAKVSHQMREACHPFLYKIVKLGTPSILNHYNTSPKFKREFGRNAIRIHELRIQGRWMEPLFGPFKSSSCGSNYVPVEVGGNGYGYEYGYEYAFGEQGEPHYNCLDLNSVICRNVKQVVCDCELIRNNTQQCLDSILHVTAILICNPVTSLKLTVPQRPRVALDLLLACPKLEEISVEYEIYPLVASELLEAMPACIRSIRLRCNTSLALQVKYTNDVSCGAMTEGSACQKERRHLARQAPPKTRPKLAQLHIRGNFTGFEEAVLFPFLNSINPFVLDDFEHEDTFVYISETLTDAMLRNGQYMVCLNDTDIHLDRFTPNFLSVDALFAHIIRINGELQDICFETTENVGTATALAIAESPQVTELDIKGCRGMSSSDIILILEHAPMLTRFWCNSDLSELALKTTKDPWIEAVDIGETRTWTTTQLDVFQCNIQCVRVVEDMPCYTTGQKKGASQKKSRSSKPIREYSHKIQRNAFRFLGLQINLTQLCLGQGWAYYHGQSQQPIFQWLSLDMTLSSGLNELTDLKSLRVFDVGFTNHLIGKCELEWMIQNWPSVEEFYGLYSNGRRTSPIVKLWVKVNNPKWVMPLKPKSEDDMDDVVDVVVRDSAES
ncbi:hypothetical protein BG004_006865 [Podila humilis]|nr:hypothetical protein BG004_006865 [Podila humilis]